MRICGSTHAKALEHRLDGVAGVGANNHKALAILVLLVQQNLGLGQHVLERLQVQLLDFRNLRKGVYILSNFPFLFLHKTVRRSFF